jgi:hypothetical protein
MINYNSYQYSRKIFAQDRLTHAGLAEQRCILHCQKVVTVKNAGTEGRKYAFETFWHFIVVLMVHSRPLRISADTLKTFRRGIKVHNFLKNTEILI